MQADYTQMTSVRCAVCGADDAELVWETPLAEDDHPELGSWFTCTNTHYGRFGRIVRCNSCGLLYRNPQEVQLLGGYEEAVDPDYLGEWPARRATFGLSLRQLARYIRPPGSMLDIGCSAGFSLRAAGEAGWRATGLEPCHWAVQQARSEGLEVVEGTLEQHPFSPGSFDVVTIWDVIEHVKDPLDVLRRAFDLVRPGGVIGLTTMDVESLAARLAGPRWPHLMRMHLCYFGYRHIERLLLEAGFVEPHRHQHVRVLRSGYLASRLVAAGDGVASAAGRVTQRGLGHLLIPICLGDLMAVFARRPA